MSGRARDGKGRFVSGKGGRVVDEDLGWAAAKRVMREIDGLAVTIGIHEGTEGGSNIAEYAFFNEFGTEHIPERSWMRSSFDAGAASYADAVQDSMGRAIVRGIDPGPALFGVGATKVRTDQMRALVELDEPPNAQSTIDRKGSSNPLYDSGAMLRAHTVELTRISQVTDE